MVKGNIFHYRKDSWPPEEYVNRTTLQLLDFDSGAPPEHAWRRKLNSHAGILKEFSVTFMEAMKMIGLGIRLWSYVREEASHGRRAPIDPFNREGKPAATQGVPLGGMGSGSITRGFRGEFRQFQIIPGACEPSPMMANQFSIFISRDGGNKKYASVLSPGKHDGTGTDQGLSSWGWNLNGQHSTYHALFPRAWTVYDGEPDPELKLSCRQISPFLPHNYRDSSLPVTVFVYTLVNTGKERAKVSLLFTWANSIGGTSHFSGDHVNEPFVGEDGVSGVLLHHKTAKDNPPVTFAIAACETQNVNVTVLPSFGLSDESHVTAKDMWGKMAQDGEFDRENFENGATFPSSAGEANCAAVSASAWVEPNGKCTVAFALAWSSPKVKFMKGKSYHRRYTKYYGTSEGAAEDLVHDALTNYKRWEEDIEKWQNPILKNDDLPEWYKFTLFNELYFLVAGGTIWIDTPLPGADDSGSDRQPPSIQDNGDANSSEEDETETPERDDTTISINPNPKSNDNHDNDDENDDVGSFLYLDSAGGSAKQGRDKNFQAILPLKGKILNVERKDEAAMYKNEEIQTLIRALGLGVKGEDFKKDGLRYHKIIILTDADVDGAHIRTLLLTFFYRYQRALFDEGCIYVGVPPLYKVERGKQAFYCYDESELKTLQSSFPSNASYTIQRFKGLGEMMPLQLWETTMDPKTRLLKKMVVEDMAEANVTFSSLMGARVDARKEMIKNTAKKMDLKNLDI